MIPRINASGTVIDMARHFEFETVAEGVEELEQFKLLQAMGCDLIQGFYSLHRMKKCCCSW